MEEFLVPAEAGSKVRRSAETLRYWRKHGTGPPWIKINGRILYPRRGLDVWIQSQSRQEEPA